MTSIVVIQQQQITYYVLCNHCASPKSNPWKFWRIKKKETKNIANSEKVWAHCKILPHSIEDMAVDKCVQTPTMPGLIDKQIRYPRLCELELFTEKCMC